MQNLICLSLRYKVLLESTFNIESREERIEEIKAFIDLIINESVGLVISRTLFTDLCQLLCKLTIEESKTISIYALDKIQPRGISFEDQVTNYRQYLSEIYEREGDFKKAANILSGIPLETSQKFVLSFFYIKLNLIIFLLILDNIKMISNSKRILK